MSRKATKQRAQKAERRAKRQAKRQRERSRTTLIQAVDGMKRHLPIAGGAIWDSLPKHSAFVKRSTPSQVEICVVSDLATLRSLLSISSTTQLVRFEREQALLFNGSFYEFERLSGRSLATTGKQRGRAVVYKLLAPQVLCSEILRARLPGELLSALQESALMLSRDLALSDTAEKESLSSRKLKVRVSSPEAFPTDTFEEIVSKSGVRIAAVGENEVHIAEELLQCSSAEIVENLVSIRRALFQRFSPEVWVSGEGLVRRQAPIAELTTLLRLHLGLPFLRRVAVVYLTGFTTKSARKRHAGELAALAGDPSLIVVAIRQGEANENWATREALFGEVLQSKQRMPLDPGEALALTDPFGVRYGSMGSASRVELYCDLTAETPDTLRYLVPLICQEIVMRKTLVGGQIGAWEKTRAAEMQQFTRRNFGRLWKVLAKQTAGADEGLASEMELTRQHDAILNLPEVEKIQLTQLAVDIATKPLVCIDPTSNSQHQLGSFLIRIAPLCQYRICYVVSLSRDQRFNGLYPNMPAPTLRDDGSLVISNLTTELPRFLWNGQILPLVKMILQRITRPSQAEPSAKYVKLWPALA